MTPSSETEFFLGWFRWESFSPGYSGHLLHQQKSRSLNKKLTFGPKYPNFGVKKSTFSPLAANWSLADQCLQHEKGVSLESRYEGTKIFTPCPQKNWILGPKTAKFGPKLAFWAKYRHF